MRLHWIILHFTGKFNTFQQETQGDKRKKEKEIGEGSFDYS